jgi:hypothetical protein
MTPEKVADSAYATTGSQSAPISRRGGKMALPRERRARIKSASVTRAPAARRNVFVATNGTVVDGMKMNNAAITVARRAHTLIVSSERRFGALVFCSGGITNYFYTY